ncbi:MAG: O-antigen ligase family protein [Acidimicrobiia bacterium]
MTAVAVAPVAAPPRARVRPGEVAVVGAAFLLLVAATSVTAGKFWTPKAAIGLLAIGPGLVALVLAVRERDRAAIASLAFLVVTGVATAWSPAPRMAVVGLYNHGTGLLFVVACVGFWALGRRLADAGRRLLVAALLAGATVNAVVAWLQLSKALHGSLFATFEGRAPGFMGNPVHAGALFVAAAALVAELWPREAPGRGREEAGARARQSLILAGAALFASAIQLAGGRIGIGLLVVVVARLAFRVGIRRAVPLAVALVVGVALASVAFPGGEGAAGRLSGAADSGVSGRIERWRIAIPAIEDRPVFGIGPGLFRRATTPHNTVAAAEAFGPDVLNIDAHDLFVEYAVTTGIVGLLALLAWLVLAARRARGPLVWFALLGGVSLLLQPQWIGLTPVLALALGAAAPRLARPFGMVGVAVGAGLVAVAIAVAVALVVGDVELHRADSGDGAGAARRATDLLAPWPDAPLTLAGIEAAGKTGARLDPAIRAARTAVARDPSSPSALYSLGSLELAAGQVDRAERTLRTARRWDPQSLLVTQRLAAIARQRGDEARVRTLCHHARELRSGVLCPPPPPTPLRSR